MLSKPRSATSATRCSSVRGLQRLLHNQRALYIKRLLLFERRVILTSVPHRMD